MTRHANRIGLTASLAAALLFGSAAAAQSGRGGATPSPAPNPSQLAESFEAVAAIDLRRLQTERTYAEAQLVHIERLRSVALASGTETAIDDSDYLRLFALPTAARAAEAREAVAEIVDRRPTRARPYIAAWYAALRIDEPDLAVAVVETASRRLRAGQWPELRQYLEEHSVWFAFGDLAEERIMRARLADALLTIGWPSLQRRETADSLRMIAIVGRLEQNDVAAAAGLAQLIISPAALLSMSVQRRYDRIFPETEDPVDRFRRATTDFDRESAAALAAAPRDGRVVLSRAQFLRGMAREDEALAVLAPFTGDVAATVAADEAGMWLVNEAGYALLELGRDDEALALFARLAALPIADTPALIGPVINQGVMLYRAGRYEEARAHSARLEQGVLGDHANDYGRLWVASTMVCALARLGRADEAGPWLGRLRDGFDANSAALTRALLCLDELDEAERVIVRRLEADDPETVLLALQDYQLDSSRSRPDPIEANLEQVRTRPAVRAAIERVGRTLSLPVARTYWGRT